MIRSLIFNLLGDLADLVGLIDGRFTGSYSSCQEITVRCESSFQSLAELGESLLVLGSRASSNSF